MPAPEQPTLPTLRIAATFTAEPLEEPLRYWGRRLGMECVVSFAGYNQIFQELLDPAGAMPGNAAGANIVLVRFKDWQTAPEQTVHELAEALKSAAARFRVPLIVVCCPPPADHAAEHAKLTELLTSETAGTPNLEITAETDILALHPVAEVHDPHGETLGRIPYTPLFFTALGTWLARRLHRAWRKPVKLIAVDADNTLWDGVVGEAGPEGVSFPAGRLLLLRKLRELRESGILLAAVSKNTLTDVQEVFRRHPDLPLSLDDFVAWKVNWSPKSQNLRELAADLDLGMDSFVFLDDNPLEIAEVQAGAPFVPALAVPSSDAIFAWLPHLWLLDTGTVTGEDRGRTASYRAQAERAGFAATAPDVRSFIEGLRLEVEIARAEKQDSARLAQLTQRTNQFNVTNRRSTEGDIARALEDGSTQAYRVSVRDRFGDYGLTGFMSATRRGDILEVEHFLLSCRVLGKGIEHRMLAALGAEALAIGCSTVRLPFTPSERNQPAHDFLTAAAGTCNPRPGEDANTFLLSADHASRLEFNPDSAALSAPAVKSHAHQSTSTTDWPRITADLQSTAVIHAAVQAARRRPRPVSAPPFIPPAGRMELLAAEAWSTALGIEPIGSGDHFFDLGGQSLAAARALAGLAAIAGIRLPLSALFEFPVLRDFAQILASADTKPEHGIVPLPRTAGRAWPLSPAQKRMWFLHRYAPDNAAYNVVHARRLHGPVDHARLRRIVAALSQRQESLRAVFPEHRGEPALMFTGPGAEFSVCDLTAAPDPEGAAIQKAREIAALPFDISAGALCRVQLCCISAEQFILTVVCHHIISDGWSTGVLFTDLAALYAGGDDALPPLTVQCLDVAAAGLEPDPASLQWWRSQLQGTPEALSLPFDFPRPAGRSFAGALVSSSLSTDVSSSLDRLARQENASLFMLLMASWQLLLSRFSRQEDIAVGTPVSGRSDAAAWPLIGCFINTLVIRSSIQNDEPFTALLQRVRETTLAAFAHQSVPFERVVEALALPRSSAVSPLFQVMLVLQNTAPAEFAAPGLTSSELPLHNGTAKFDLVLEAIPSPAGLCFRLEYNTALFREDTARQILQCYTQLLRAITENPNTPSGHLSLMDAAETSRLLRQWSQPPSKLPPPVCSTVHGWFEHAAAQWPGRTAVTCGDTAWTYAELNARANRIARLLIDRGVTVGTPVAICMDRSPSLVAGLLGILKAGACYVPIDLSYPPERLTFMLEDAQAPVLLTESALLSKLPQHGAFTICPDEMEAGADDSNPHLPISPEALAYILYTSGSTGKPKGCCITHSNVTRLFSSTWPWFQFDEHDVWTLFHSTAFDFSVWELWGALFYGGRLVVVPWLVSRSPEDFRKLLSEQKVTVLNQTPSAFKSLIAADAVATTPLALRCVIFGGEALEMQSLQPWFERHGDQKPQLVNMYGITETTVHVTWRPLSRTDLTAGSVIGIPIPDLHLYVLDTNGQPCPVGVPGEMYVAGAGLAKGYLNRPELTAERFPESWLPADRPDEAHSPYQSHRLYKTGDLARRLPNGDLEFLGRIDDQVKIRGFRIELGEIESVLCTHPAIREACVLVREDRPGDKRLCAWIVSNTPPSAADLREHLRTRLPEYMIPAAFVPLSAFPLTTNGKLDRRALPAPVVESAARTFTAPSTPNEHTLAAIWAKVLRVERVGTQDNFFELGGDSILSIQVIARAREAGLTLTPRQLFENPTVAALAALAMDKPTTTPSSVPSEITGPFQPSPIQEWFLTQELEGANHWNQTFLFTVSERLDTAALTAALRAIVQHHSALRQRFIRRNNIWEASIHAEPDEDILTLHDLSSYENGRLVRQIERACKVEQARLSFEFGPLLRAAYMDCGEDRPGRLLITVHHLAVDGVSWRILLEDIEKAYRQAAAGKPITLPAATAPFSAWAGQVRAWAKTEAARSDTAFWQTALTENAAAATLRSEGEDGYGSNTESDTYTLRTRLSIAETEALLQKVPAAYSARINAPLLAALVQAVHQAQPVPGGLAIHLEGHGRESHIGAEMDVSRTVGWFTTIFPVHLQPSTDHAAGIRAVQQQLDALPGHGSGFSALGLKHDAAILFNYLGRMDSITSGSELFSFAPESTGPWHCQTAERKYQIEINAQVIGGELEVAWTAGRQLHSEAQIQQFAEGFVTALQGIITESGTVAAAPQTALSGLDEDIIARLIKGQTGIVEISALSPMQQLFYSASLTKPNAGYDQWYCHLHGPLDIEKLRAAWCQVIARHSILRSSFHSAGLPHPVQIVREGIEPEWTIIEADEDAEKTIARLLADDAGQRNDLTKPMLSRFTLLRLADDHHFLLWSLPDLHLDGWSWPIVFSEVNTLRNGGSLPPSQPYSTWLHWLSKQSEESSRAFWRQNLSGYTSPTPLPSDLTPGPKASRRTAEATISFPGAGITAAARSLSLSPGTFVQAAWALLLAHAAGENDVVFGTAFSGRPATLPGAESIVGPFVNNLPVRLHIDRTAPASSVLQSLQATLLDLSEHQYTPITAIQDCTDIPWKSRLFNSLAVFQNYSVPDTAKHFGDAKIADFTGPIHTAYPLTLVVTPGDEWNATLVFQESVCTPARAKAILNDFTALLNALAANPGATCAEALKVCQLPANCATTSAAAPMRRPGGTAPRTKMEQTLAALWRKAFGIDDITTEDNFFDLGGGSLLMVRLHAAISQELQRDVPLVDLFRFPTIASLARHLDPAASTATSAVRVVDQTQSRAAAARAAASKARDLRTR